MGVREVVMGVAALLGVYLVYVLLRLARLAYRRRWPKKRAVLEYETVLELSTAAPEAAREVVRLEPVRADPAPAREGFDALVELARLRFQVEALESNHASLQTEVLELRSELDALRNARNVAPQYGEAVGLAQRGLAADAIAERCGISVSEAELVAALSRGAANKEQD